MSKVDEAISSVYKKCDEDIIKIYDDLKDELIELRDINEMEGRKLKSMKNRMEVF